MALARKALIAGVLTAVVAGAVAGGWWYHRHQTSSGAAGSIVIPDSTGPFEASACQSRMFEDQPALAVLFSAPVERGQAFDKLIQVTDLGRSDGARETSQESTGSGAPRISASGAGSEEKLLNGNWVMGDNPRVLYFTYVKPQRNYRVRVGASLKAEGGSTLGQIKDCSIATEEMPPSYFFASKGTVLPARQNGGLPVITVNVPEVDIQFLRVEQAQMPYFLETVGGFRRTATRPDDDDGSDGEEGCADCYYGDNSSLKGQTYSWQLDKLNSISKSVYAGRFVTSDKANARKVTHLPIEGIKELQEPGIYIAVMSQPGRFREDYQVTYFYVTDIGLHAHRFNKGIDVFATSLTSGKAISDADLEVIDANGKSLVKGKLDSDGHALLTGVTDNASLVVAHRGKEMSVIALREPALDLSEFDIGGYLPRDAKLFLYAGRDLYRPGEKFDVSMLARDTAGHPLPPAPIQAILKRPDGKSVQTMTWKPESRIPGYFRRTISLPADAQTGRWSIELRADPNAKMADTVWPFQVEEFVPERMKLDLKTNGSTLAGDAAFAITVQGDYLFGAPAAGNRLLGSVAQERDTNPVAKQWPGFVFGDFADDTRKSRSEMEETTLDEKGHASVSPPFDVNGAHSPMTIRASLSLLESGGRPVVRSIERVWWPAPQLIGVRPEFDSNVTRENSPASFELARVGMDGKFAPLGEAAFRLFREDREYYWRYDDQKGWHSGFTETEEVVQSGKISLKQRGHLTLPVTWGRFRLEVTDPQTGETLRYRFYAGWNAQNAEEVGNRPDRVQLKLEGAPVKPGDSVKVNIVPPHDGEALVVVEADKVLWTKRISVSTSGTEVKIPIDKSWTRNDMYVAVTVFRPGSQGDRVTPARAIGLSYLPLQNDSRHLKVQLSAPDKVLPEKRSVVKVKVEGAAGQPAMVTLSAVDVGILNITRFKTPDPFDFFFGKHRYAPELRDLYGKLIEKMDGDKGKLKWGGDAGMRDTRSMPRKIKLIDLFSGPVTLNDKGEAEIPLDIPDFNGTLRLMAVAATADNYGDTDREMVVAAPVVAELSTPRFISAGDSATLALDVTNLSGSDQKLSVRLTGADPVRIKDGERTVTLANKQRTTLRFTAEPTDAYGLARLKLEVHGEGAKPISIVRESALQVQPPLPLVHEVRRVKIDAGSSLKLDPALADRYFKGSSAVSISMSNHPPLNVRSVVKGLLDYPYGCLEQTTSAAYPYVVIDEATARQYGIEPRTREQRAQFVEGAISRIAGMQGAKGGFNLWGNGPYEIWLTAYATNFMLDARAQGFSVPDRMIRRAEDWMLATLQTAPNAFPTLPSTIRPDEHGNYRYQDYELLRNSHERFAEMAHIAFVLAREQKAPLATLRILHDQYRNRARSPLPLVHLSLALQMMGDASRAKVALDEAMKLRYGIQADSSWEWLGHDYGSRTRDLALSYALLTQYKVKHPRLDGMLFSLADSLGNRSWLSTQERMALLLAANTQGNGDTRAEWTAILQQGEKAATISAHGNEIRSLDPAMLARGEISLENKSQVPLYAEIEASGYPLKPPAPKSDVIALERDWFHTDGSPWRGGPLKVGDMLIVRVTATAKQRIDEGMVIDHIPAGLEVENLNLSQGPQAGEFTVGGVNVAEALNDTRIRHQEYRDDRYVAAAALSANKLTLFYMLRVVTPGTYTVPSSYAEDMYRPELRGVGTSSPAISVIDPKGAEK